MQFVYTFVFLCYNKKYNGVKMENNKIKLYINKLVKEVDEEGKSNWLERVLSYAYKIIQVGEYNHELYQNIKDGKEKFDARRDLETFAAEQKGMCGTFVEIFLLACFQDKIVKDYMPYITEIYCKYGEEKIPHAIAKIDVVDGGRYIDFSSIIHLAKDKPCAFKGDIKNYFFVDYDTIVNEFEESRRQLNIVNNNQDEKVSPYFIAIKHHEDAQNNKLGKEIIFEDYLNSIVKDNKCLPLGSIILNDKISEKNL